MPQARLDALQTLLAGLVARPEPGILVIACADTEVFYLAHALEQLDEGCPADRFFVHPEDVNTITDYVTGLYKAAGRAPPDPASDPATQVHALCIALLADLPPGDHHLVVALLPTDIHDAPGFSTLAQQLLELPLDPRLRIVLRDDRAQPRHFELAAASLSEHHIAHVFALPPAMFVDATRNLANDPRARPDDRAQALLQLACLDLGHGRHTDALARCAAARTLSTAPPLQLLALAFETDVLRHSGDHHKALALGMSTLEQAVALDARPIVLHLAFALGELTRDLARPADAAACFALAERAAPFSTAVQARARALRAELPPC